MIELSTALETQYLLDLLDCLTLTHIAGRYSFDLDEGLATIACNDAVHALRLQSATLHQIRTAFGLNRNHTITSIEYRWGDGPREKWRHPIPRI